MSKKELRMHAMPLMLPKEEKLLQVSLKERHLSLVFLA